MSFKIVQKNVKVAAMRLILNSCMVLHSEFFGVYSWWLA